MGLLDKIFWKRKRLITKYYENGQKKWEKDFKDGKFYGFWTFWDEDGSIIKSETYRNGKLVR